MDDLISRQSILKHIEKIRQGALMMDDIRRASIIMNGMDLCEETAMNQPSADALKVVRCKDCKWFNDTGCAIRIVDDSDKPTENDYCSFGEWKDG